MKARTITTLTLLFVISCATAQTPKPTANAPKPEATPEATVTPAASEQARIPGVLSGEGDNIIVPAAITSGKEFSVTVRTGGNGCWFKGDASVVLGERSADIFVYDLTNATRPGTMCTMIYKQFDHKVALRFAEKGEAVIRIWTRGDGDGPMGKPIIVEKRITVN